MNAPEIIFALALASNLDAAQHFTFAYTQLATLGKVQFSSVYQIPCRDGIEMITELSVSIKKHLII